MYRKHTHITIRKLKTNCNLAHCEQSGDQRVRVRDWRLPPPLVEISDVKPPPHGVKTYTIMGEGKPPVLFLSDTCDLAQPSTQWASSIWSTHSKHIPSRALVDGFCLLSTNIVAFCNCFLLNWSDVTNTSSQSLSFASLSSSYGNMWRNAYQTMRLCCVVSGEWRSSGDH